MKQLAVGVIGAGNMGIHHIRNYYYHPKVQFVGVVDRDAKKLSDIQNNFPVDVFSDYNAIIDQVDAVSIVTPTSTHFQIAKECLLRGKHVLLEKPMTSNMQEAEELLELAEKNKVVLAIGHIERFNPVIGELQHVLQGNRPLFIDIHRESPYDSRIFDTDVISDLMIHDIDLLCYLLDDPIDVKSGYGIQVRSNASDLVNVQLVTTGGTLINITTSRITQQKIRQWRIIFNESLVEADLLERKLQIMRKTSVEMELLSNKTEIKYRQDQLVEKVLVPHYEPLQMEINDFIDSILNGRPPLVSAVEGIKVLALIEQLKRKMVQTSRYFNALEAQTI
ncbi:oxidoreductase [Paenibacillus baekrokdamisoli]|uniref:Oxidoreductase n=1 Tax=Paenibacillus baekrokdamisoli TaxID=1712516 RepID=A0A3G9JLJ7_9BACL|nr:Gfo/Idh/MocA family oxidoreductase [Paenibacillus baekrokdamisoli]MBB3069095.1 putative dehydrogenase [Paenibacillus baekrokdamisoli]BBH23909.1 oxidoreductase [Paenibacillus baekrokdamisoli]